MVINHLLNGMILQVETIVTGQLLLRDLSSSHPNGGDLVRESEPPKWPKNSGRFCCFPGDFHTVDGSEIRLTS